MLHRRHFLSLAGMTLGSTLINQPAWAEAAAPMIGDKRLIVVMLRGAVDGLNVVVPYGDPHYAGLRPTLALGAPGTPNGVMDLDGTFGLNPALAPLMPLWRSKRLGFVHASGSPDASRSHFEAQDYLETATPGVRTTQDGWMNRLISTLPSPHGPTQALNIGERQPHILSGPLPTSTIALNEAIAKPRVTDRPAVAKAFESLYGGSDALSQAYQQGQQANQEIAAQMTPAMQAEQEAANRGAPQPKGFPAIAQRLGTLMARDALVRLAFTDVGGWDTHVNQGTTSGDLANRLDPLAKGLLALTDSLGPTLDKTVIVVMSEFGRTAHENGTRGTDHGHGNVMWLLGGPVAGGKIHGVWPGLDPEHLHEGRDLAVTSDFRAVLAAVLAGHMTVKPRDLARILPNPDGYGGPMKGLMT